MLLRLERVLNKKLIKRAMYIFITWENVGALVLKSEAKEHITHNRLEQVSVHVSPVTYSSYTSNSRFTPGLCS
jgi:hypothetical protein